MRGSPLEIKRNPVQVCISSYLADEGHARGNYQRSQSALREGQPANTYHRGGDGQICKGVIVYCIIQSLIITVVDEVNAVHL